MCYRLLLALALCVAGTKDVTGARRRLQASFNIASGGGASITAFAGSVALVALDPPIVPDYVISKAGAYTCPHGSSSLDSQFFAKADCAMFALDPNAFETGSAVQEIDQTDVPHGCFFEKDSLTVYWNTGSPPATFGGDAAMRLVCLQGGRPAPYWFDVEYGAAGSADCPAGSGSEPVASFEDCQQYTVQDSRWALRGTRILSRRASKQSPSASKGSGGTIPRRASSTRIAPRANLNEVQSILDARRGRLRNTPSRRATWNNASNPMYMASMGNPANSDKIAPGCNVNIDENIVLWNENTENTAGHDAWRRICRDPLPVPAPTLFPTASPTPTATYTEETCGGENLHRYPSLESCCDDLGLPEHQEDLTAFLEDLEGDALTSFTDKCAEHYSL
mmetsp:Transcript_4782/g.14166  ORF Transcript_4782/g.14166 Transcript_4782/m.14166 type:complete len:393 (+) Transcript_4782:178-1356(+)